jgi:hypothetical protein
LPTPRRFPLPVKVGVDVRGIPGGDKVDACDVGGEFVSGNNGESGPYEEAQSTRRKKLFYIFIC